MLKQTDVDLLEETAMSNLFSLLVLLATLFYQTNSSEGFSSSSFVKGSNLLLQHDKQNGFLISQCQAGSKSSNANEDVPEIAESESLSYTKCYEQYNAEFEMVNFHRILIGGGAHRLLNSQMKLKYINDYSDLSNSLCKLIIMEMLPSDIFVDPFELERLIQRGDLEAAYVHGDTNLELPSLQSDESIVEVHVTIDDMIYLSGKSFLLDVNINLPVHSRYPPLIQEGYKNVIIGIPHIIVHCINKNMTKINRNQRNMQAVADRSVEYRNSLVKSLDSFNTSHVLKWRIPSGNPSHAFVVAVVTLLSGLVSIAVIFITAVHSVH